MYYKRKKMLTSTKFSLIQFAFICFRPFSLGSLVISKFLNLLHLSTIASFLILNYPLCIYCSIIGKWGLLFMLFNCVNVFILLFFFKIPPPPTITTITITIDSSGCFVQSLSLSLSDVLIY